jgi:hypothetical protein
MPHERGFPVHAAAGCSAPAFDDANTDSFFSSFFDPQCGQGVPFQLLDRTNTSLSRSHWPQ